MKSISYDVVIKIEVVIGWSGGVEHIICCCHKHRGDGRMGGSISYAVVINIEVMVGWCSEEHIICCCHKHRGGDRMGWGCRAYHMLLL